MLPTELLSFGVKGGVVTPRRLKPTEGNLQLAETLTGTFEEHLGRPRFELDEALAEIERGRRDFKVIRGLAHLLTQQSTFEAAGGVPPERVREKVFALAQEGIPSRRRTAQVLETARRELGINDSQNLSHLLYADLPDQQTMTQAPQLSPTELIQRYDLANAQGMLYRAYSLVITARRNQPARYKQLLQYTKFFGLMLTVEGDPKFGFTLTMDGPSSLLGSTTRYGLAMAKFLPALLHVTKWDLTAEIKARKDLAWVDPKDDVWTFELTSEDGYVSHYREPEEHDSALEAGFAERFSKLDTEWTLEREVDLVPVPGGVILPDFRLEHPDGRSVLVEIVGYWRPEYLRKKFELLRKSGRDDVIVCVSERLNLDKAGVKHSDFRGRTVWFKGVLKPQDVLALAEAGVAKKA
ncbi:DUF790 family protein [Deinococcus sp. SL84]|uniref:DUF790 family protein n=1 Tax=Deinococcus sp. SL84 TaxID=2994663 RepID=UPI002272BD5F|nr:DUF790 family protein [Deinococcus sp. SL84]MCY1703945.1 DUF790 family protein [Deinococcus sp. SL84]